MPTFLDFHSIGRLSKNDFKKGNAEPRDEFGVKVLNPFMTWNQKCYFAWLMHLIKIP
jgi:hypothetical protein